MVFSKYRVVDEGHKYRSTEGYLRSFETFEVWWMKLVVEILGSSLNIFKVARDFPYIHAQRSFRDPRMRNAR